MNERYFIVYYKDKELKGFPYLKSRAELKRLLIACDTDEKVEKYQEQSETKTFKSMVEMNDYFNESDMTHLIILKNGTWYCRAQGTMIFKEIPCQPTMTVEAAAAMVSKDTDSLNSAYEHIWVELQNNLREDHDAFQKFKEEYANDQKWAFYLDMGLFVLIVATIIVMFIK